VPVRLVIVLEAVREGNNGQDGAMAGWPSMDAESLKDIRVLAAQESTNILIQPWGRS